MKSHQLYSFAQPRAKAALNQAFGGLLLEQMLDYNLINRVKFPSPDPVSGGQQIIHKRCHHGLCRFSHCFGTEAKGFMGRSASPLWWS